MHQPSMPGAPDGRFSPWGAQQMGLPLPRVDEMLEMVSLSQNEAKRRLRNYSLGMRQRLC